jgi:serine/threonine protein kinase
MDANTDDERKGEGGQPLVVNAQEQWKQVRRTNRIQRARVRMLPQETSKEEEETLAEGEVILDGHYRIVELLYRRPRLRLYLARRVSLEQASEEEIEHVVAIRELVLGELPELVREQIEKAAFEEFVAPIVLGPSQLSTGGDRVWTKGERHYLVMQLHDRKNVSYADVSTLDKLVLGQREWPTWLTEEVALSWGTRLCRIVARLHRLGIVLGDLDLATILVSSAGASAWSPILLASWPPPAQFWEADVGSSKFMQMQRQIFPAAKVARWNAFIAPEVLSGSGDERSDIYTLGAILYLLLTHYAPVAAIYRLQASVQMSLAEEESGSREQTALTSQGAFDTSDCLELIAPHLLYHHIPELLEQIVVRALELDPARRYPSVFALVEALEAAELEVVMEEKAHTRKTGTRKFLVQRARH